VPDFVLLPVVRYILPRARRGIATDLPGDHNGDVTIREFHLPDSAEVLVVRRLLFPLARERGADVRGDVARGWRRLERFLFGSEQSERQTIDGDGIEFHGCY